MPSTKFLALILLFMSAGSIPALAQPEVMGWGNLNGIRVDGHLLEFNTGLCVVQPEWAGFTRTAKERQTTTFTRSGSAVTVKYQIRPTREIRQQGAAWTMNAVQTVTDSGPGKATVDVEFTSPKDAEVAGGYFCIELPASHFSGGTVQIAGAAPPAAAEVALSPGAAEQNEYLRTTASGLVFKSPGRQLEVTFKEPVEVIIRDDRRKGNYDLQVFLGVLPAKPAAGQTATRSFALKATGELDKAPVTLAIDHTRPGQAFDGLGGNFRIQNPKLDSSVIDYNLENLRVTWARVEMPWRLWDPEENADPLAAARAGKVNPRVTAAMEMARRLSQKGMPVIVSSWSAPNWAILGDPRNANAQEDPRGNPLNPEKMDRILTSLTGYMLFMKEKYGVETAMFSFNESDLGINVRQTAREHAELIRKLGAYMASKDLSTKMLLGDTSDANPVWFIQDALRDPEAIKYIGAVSFHSWRGCSPEILTQWREAARRINVPLLVGEGSTDAAAWRYSQIFQEQSFALYEIDLYTRILAIGQPKSILQWQLTADYSLLAGNGLGGDNGPLRPTQRFWNLKQLASTPRSAFALPVTCDRPGLTCAAFGDIANGTYAVHIVNNGAARQATLTGLPQGVKELRLWVTDTRRGMQEGARIPVVEGKAVLPLDATCFTTLISVPESTN